MSEYLSRSELADIDLTAKLAEEMALAFEGRLLIDEVLSKHTSWRVGGPARFYAYPKTVESLAAVYQFCASKRLRVFTIGYGTNLLASDDGFAGCVIDLVEGAQTLKVNGDELTAGGGVWLGDAVRIAAEHGLGGMEKLAGIPGGVGGGASMNAGAFGMAISDHLVEVQVVSWDGKIRCMSKSDVGFGYRSAPGLVGQTVYQARFQLLHQKKSEVIRAVEDTITERFRRHVMTLPSAGSVFKNPSGGFSAKMVEAIGGKGMSEGGVEVSSNHANFIVNARGGTAGDVIRLIRRIRGKVREQFGVTLELEVRTLGFEEGLDLG